MTLDVESHVHSHYLSHIRLMREREREKTIGFIGLCISQKYPLSFAVSLTIVIAIIIRLAIMRSFNYKARASSARPVPLNE